MNSLVTPTQAQQLQMLKEQTRLTGALHSAQVLQLKLWPLVVFQEALGSEFTWDPDKKTVTFKLDFPAKSRTKKLAWWKERVAPLNEWVQVLLGDEWMIHVKAGGKTYNGSRKINVRRNDPNKPEADAGAKGSAPDGA